MLTDVFVHRYQNTVLTDQFGPKLQALMTQGYRLIFEQLFPFWVDGKINEWADKSLKQVHDRLSMELGLIELSPKHYTYQSMWNGNQHTYAGTYSLDNICKTYLCKAYDGSMPPSQFLAERLSFFELAFRLRGEQVAKANADLPRQILSSTDGPLKGFTTGRNPLLRGYTSEVIQAGNDTLNSKFRENVDELNTRLRQAGFNLNYHNGFIQLGTETTAYAQIEKPFWELMSGDIWKNVDIDMKEAIDRRDNGGRDPALYAAKALESAIKIISDQLGLTTGNEKGAANYIDNIVSAKNGRFIDVWEADALKALFAKVRNPLGHGPGTALMPELSIQQTDWAIETVMSWIKSLIRRLQP